MICAVGIGDLIFNVQKCKKEMEEHLLGFLDLQLCYDLG